MLKTRLIIARTLVPAYLVCGLKTKVVTMHLIVFVTPGTVRLTLSSRQSQLRSSHWLLKRHKQYNITLGRGPNSR